jgi:xylulokinase
MKPYILGIDIGTSACKVVAFDISGDVVASVLCPYDVHYPRSGWAEQYADDWWQAVCHALQCIWEQGKVHPADVVGVGVDGQSWSALPVSCDGRALRPTIIWFDRRAQQQAECMVQAVGLQRLIEVSGNPPDPAYITPKMLWLKENEPDIYNGTYKFLQSNGFIVYKLTGCFTQDKSQGYGFHFFNIAEGVYDEELCRQMGLDIDKVADIFECCDVVGSVTDEAARSTGLLAGTPVVAGGLDAAASTLGAGVISVGQTQEQGGQAGGMSIYVDKPVIEPRLILGYHVVPDAWLLQGGTVGGGGALRWFVDQFGYAEVCRANKEGVSVYGIVDREASSIKPGSDGLIFLPYMSGERSPIWNPKARGVFFGLSYDKTRAHAARAVMEGCAYSLRHNIEVAQQAGAHVDELISVGGAAKSSLWTQIKADVTKKRIQVPYADDATALGAAMLAGVGIGAYKDFREAVSKTVRIRASYEPNADNFYIYDKLYAVYREVYENLEQTYDKLYEVQQEGIL